MRKILTNRVTGARGSAPPACWRPVEAVKLKDALEEPGLAYALPAVMCRALR